MNYIKKIISDISDSVIDDNIRFKLQYLWIYRILIVISFFMTALNLVTQKYLLMGATLIFGVVCIINIVLLRYIKSGMQISRVIFMVEIFCLFTFFAVSGIPEGFSVIWICLLPSCGLLLFGRKTGSVLSFIMLVTLIFLFWTPVGRSILQYKYTDSFLMRFPLLYLAFYAVSLFLETIRVLTQQRMLEAQQKYQYLYLRDALTGVYNRYGFDEQIERVVRNVESDGMALMILDIDFLKVLMINTVI